MTTEPIGPAADDTPQDLVQESASERLPKTVPLKNPKSGATQQSIQLPDESEQVFTQNLRFTQRGEDHHTPPVRVATRLLSAAATGSTMRRPGRKSGRSPNPTLPDGARPRLRVLRGQRLNTDYAIFDGANTIGRRDDRPIDIDLEDQEPADRVWTSRKHAVVHLSEGVLELEDLNSLNGTFVNRVRLAPGSKRVLVPNDVIQVGTVQLRVVV